MSRIGKKPIEVPAGVKITLEGEAVNVEGSKGKLSHKLPSLVGIRIENNTIFVETKVENTQSASLHGLTRTLIANMVTGVTAGFVKTLDIVDSKGGYRAAMKGKTLDLSIGKSHPTIVEPPAGIEFGVEGQHKILVKGIDKALVGRVAAEIRSLRKPEPYLGKGIRYHGERVVLKAGKSGKK
ncbi:MAG: 50S ribosomal protein L6 [Deferribacteraceae bacterium]|jgi:large subunit ribosomal protein L6|nr:50S ribosomal protein L6 [Deferribacteraceae bacterium]